ncbi:MAG: hypothetical protein U0517_00600 [Candidatus Andersenbacteria bacterium]
MGAAGRGGIGRAIPIPPGIGAGGTGGVGRAGNGDGEGVGGGPNEPARIDLPGAMAWREIGVGGGGGKGGRGRLG